MPNKSELKWVNCFDLPNPGLRSYFALVEKGQPDEYRTTFYRNRTVDKVLSEWDRILKPISKEWPSLYEFESDLRKKVGPMSIMKPLSERLTDIDNYYDCISLSQEPISDRALKSVSSEWDANHRLALRSQSDTVSNMKKSTNSGAPFFTKRKDVLSQSYPCDVYPFTQDLPKGKWGIPAVLGWRGQEGGPTEEDVKQRVVWMFPFAVNIAELQVYQPLIEYAQQHNIVPAWISMEAVDQRITNLFDTKGEDDIILCTDFSKFDQHFNPVCQDAAHRILSDLLTHDSNAINWLEKVFPIKYEIPLAYRYGKIRSGPHGMASGSGGTNADETVVHRALQYEAAQSQGQILNPNSQCLGDDGILSYPGITAEDVMRSYTAHGLEMNPDKQYESKHDCIYLRRWHHDRYRVNDICVGVYSTFRALGRLCEQERYYDGWSKEMTALRQLSIIENCKWHPYRERFANYCIKGDKYRLGIDIPNFLDNIDRIAKEATDKMPDFLGYTKSMQQDNTGLSSWWIVNYLKSKA